MGCLFGPTNLIGAKKYWAKYKPTTNYHQPTMSLPAEVIEKCGALGIKDPLECAQAFGAIQQACTTACMSDTSTNEQGELDGKGYLSHSCASTKPIGKGITCQHFTAEENMDNPDEEKANLARQMAAALQTTLR